MNSMNIDTIMGLSKENDHRNSSPPCTKIDGSVLGDIDCSPLHSHVLGTIDINSASNHVQKYSDSHEEKNGRLYKERGHTDKNTRNRPENIPNEVISSEVHSPIREFTSKKQDSSRSDKKGLKYSDSSIPRPQTNNKEQLKEYELGKDRKLKTFKAAGKAIAKWITPTSRSKQYRVNTEFGIVHNTSYEGPTELHDKCYHGSWDEVLSCFKKECERVGGSFSDRSEHSDDSQRNPLHLLGLNKSMLSSFENIDVIIKFLVQGDNMSLLLSEDENGYFPFEEVLRKWSERQWIEDVKECTPGDMNDVETDLCENDGADWSSRRTLFASESTKNSWIDLPDEVAYVLSLISEIVDKLYSNVSGDGISPTVAREDRVLSSQDLYRRRMLKQQSIQSLHLNTRDDIHQYVTRISGIKNLMKKLLYLGDEDRRYVFNCSIVKRVMLKPESLGKWLVDMFHDQNDVKERAAEYFVLLSETIHNDAGTTERVGVKEALHQELLKHGNLMSSMLMLKKSHIEDVASTPLISNVIDSLISTPFVATFLFADMFLWLLLIFCFRKGVDGYFIGADKDIILRWIWFANAFGAYFLMRELIRGVAMMSMSYEFSKYEWIHSTSFINVSSLILLVYSVFLMRMTVHDDILPESEIQEVSQNTRTMLALTTGMLWLKFLCLLKSINIKLATFVTSIVEITKDIFWYLAILGIITICFSQVFFTMLVPTECLLSDNADRLDCIPREYYIRVYSVLLGDWGLFDRDEDFEEKSHALLVFVAFSFFIAIVLLNVLIAIISDSYNHCLQRSRHLFGRSRVFLLAELVAFRDIGVFRDEQENTASCLQKWHPKHLIKWIRSIEWTEKGVIVTLIIPAVLSIAWLILDFHGVRRAYDKPVMIVLIIIATLVFNSAVLVFFLSLLSASKRTKEKKGNRMSKCVTWLMLRLLGKGGEDNHVHQRDNISQKLNDISERLTRLEDRKSI